MLRIGVLRAKNGGLRPPTPPPQARERERSSFAVAI
jgi:hypothetical protein